MGDHADFCVAVDASVLRRMATKWAAVGFDPVHDACARARVQGYHRCAAELFALLPAPPTKEAPAGHDRPCPKCGGLIDTEDKSDGSRLTCPHCKARPYLHHHAPYGDDCAPECFDTPHWGLSMKKAKG